tara:strand:+ start:502 stop:633 length:132 start_codon:yes stop_codon:yes gene_type:complete
VIYNFLSYNKDAPIESETNTTSNKERTDKEQSTGGKTRESKGE